MRLLGAVLAGGESLRFGSDKALARIDGATLLDHAIAALSPQADRVVICGRDGIADRPMPGLGPLGGLNAALHLAAQEGFDAVLSAPADAYPVPADLAARLGEGPSYVATHYLLGLWPTRLADMLDAHLAAGQRSVRSWIAACGAAAIEYTGPTIHNVNTPAALALLGMAGDAAQT